MSWAHLVLLFVAGITGGLTGSIAGLASVATYPALLAVGLPPVSANVTNTVALVFNAVGSMLGSRPELAGQGRWLWRMSPFAVVGGAVGAALLLTTPSDGFEKIVPVLLGFSALTIALPHSERADSDPNAPAGGGLVIWQAAAIFVIAVYGGYFGAAAGVVLLALLLRTGHATLAHANAAKNVLLGAANLVAAVGFAILAPVHWAAVVPLGLGCLLGSRIGPVVVRHTPATPTRVLIGIAAIALAVKLGIDAYT
ncbi:MAG TPA: sulfite exporter TauE/SafE family protein [Mycobacterium sp.]|nr:sulfite exporter TauE/SafE family protein [Mycobacterium sp.]